MAKSLPVLIFHTLDNQGSVISFPPALFEHMIASMFKLGYRTISLSDAVECLRRQVPFPERSFAITFDDGYRTVYTEAFRVLQEYGMSATVFLTVGTRVPTTVDDRLPGSLGRTMLYWREIQEMQRWGVEFGAHTLTHPDLTRLSSDEVEWEICESKATLEDALGAPVTCFAYPYGRYDERSYAVARRCFASAYSDQLGLITASSDSHALERVDMYYFRSIYSFPLLGTRFFPWYVGLRALGRRIRRGIAWR